jgi:hypothetical protein
MKPGPEKPTMRIPAFGRGPWPRFVVVSSAIILMVAATGCENNDFTLNSPDNRPPQIILSGPDYDTSAPLEEPLPSPWVVVGDPDGSEDIAAVVLRVSRVELLSVIVRPDDAGQECSRPFYADMDTIDVRPFLETTEFEIEANLLYREQTGRYGSSLSYYELTQGGLGPHSDVFGEWPKGCRWGVDYLYMVEHLGLYPPAIPVPRDVYVTRADFRISGISITAYDQSGASATVTFPDFRGYFTSDLEKRVLP